MDMSLGNCKHCNNRRILDTNKRTRCNKGAPNDGQPLKYRFY